MFLKKSFCIAVLALLLPLTAWSQEGEKVDCDVQFEACIDTCEKSGDENCERTCDVQYEKCLAEEK